MIAHGGLGRRGSAAGLGRELVVVAASRHFVSLVHAGSDVVEAFAYYAHREKMRLVGKEHLLEQLNRQALTIAKEVAAETGALFAGDICNTNVFIADDASRRAVREMFDEQVGWAVEAGVDFVIGETFSRERKRRSRSSRSTRPACRQWSRSRSIRNR